MDKDIVEKNTDIITGFRAKRIDQLIYERHNTVQVHAVLQSMPFATVYSELLSKLTYLDEEIVGKKFFALLNDALLKIQKNPPVDIYWVRDVEHSTRKIREDGSIQQLFQGRNPNISSPTYYEGDRSLADKAPDHMQPLQPHLHGCQGRGYEGHPGTVRQEADHLRRG